MPKLRFDPRLPFVLDFLKHLLGVKLEKNSIEMISNLIDLKSSKYKIQKDNATDNYLP